MVTAEQKWFWRTLIRVILLGSALAGVLWTIHSLREPGALSPLTPLVVPAGAPAPTKPPLTTPGGNQ